MPCQVIKREGFTAIACSRGAGRRKLPACYYCGAPAGFDCDFPIGDGKTCDRHACMKHSVHVGFNLDYCAAHQVTTKLKPESERIQ